MKGEDGRGFVQSPPGSPAAAEAKEESRPVVKTRTEDLEGGYDVKVCSESISRARHGPFMP